MHIYSQMYKYNLLSVYIVTWRHHFRDYCLVSDDQLICSSLGKTFFHVQYLLVAYSPLGFFWSFSLFILSCLLEFFLLSSCLGSNVGGTLCVSLLSLLENTISLQMLFPLALTISMSPFIQ